MKSISTFRLALILFIVLTPGIFSDTRAQGSEENSALDEKVKKFLDSHRGQWHEMNVPASDGKLLYEIIVKNKYRKALEIGTSTGHSGIWIAWALSKTGGKLITIDIDEDRHKQAVANFKECGLSAFIDARLADAHDLVKELKGPFDFVFSDADKDWYKQYFIDVAPKLEVGGCFTAHNVYGRRRAYGGIGEYVEHISSLKNFETTFNTDGGGVAISYKKADK